MEHYQKLIIKGLINGGGSSSETYTHAILTGKCSEESRSVSGMWDYLGVPLQKMLIDILDDICGVDLNGKDDSQIVKTLIDHMANKGGRNEFFATHSQKEINNMSESEYERGIDDLIQAKKINLLNLE